MIRQKRPVWTDKKPTKPGWYWVKSKWASDTQYSQSIVRIESTADGLEIYSTSGWPWSLVGTKLFSGPIPEPSMGKPGKCDESQTASNAELSSGL